MGRAGLEEEAVSRRLPDEAERLAAPIVVTCAEGSGLAIVADFLAHAGVYMGPREVVHGSPYSSPIEAAVDLIFADVLSLRSIGGIDPDRLSPLMLAEIDRLLRDAIVAHLRDMPATWTRWGVVSARLAHLLPLLERVLPAQRVVHVLRDGRDVAAMGDGEDARRRALSSPSDNMESALEEAGAVLSGRAWSAVLADMRGYGDVVGRAPVVEVRFEDLIETPEQASLTLGRGLGISMPTVDGFRRSAAARREIGTAGVASELDDETAASVELVIRSDLMHLNYIPGARRRSAGKRTQQIQPMILTGVPGTGLSLTAGLLVSAGFRAGADAERVLFERSAGLPIFRTGINRRVAAIHDRLLENLDRDRTDAGALPEGWEKSAAATAARSRLVALLPDLFDDLGPGNPPLLMDPGFCRLLPLWANVCADMDWAPPHILVLVRDPEAVVSGLAARENLPTPFGFRLWSSMMLDLEKSTRAMSRTVLDDDRILSDAAQVLEPVLNLAGIHMPWGWREAVKTVVDRSLRSPETILPQSAERDFAAGIWSSFLDLAEAADETESSRSAALRRLDTRATQSRQLDIVAAGWIDRFRVERRAASIAHRTAGIHVAAGHLTAAREAGRVALLSSRRAENAEFLATSALYRDWVSLLEPDAQNQEIQDEMAAAWAERPRDFSVSVIVEPSCWSPEAAKRCLAALKAIAGKPNEIVVPFHDWPDVSNDALVDVLPINAKDEAAWLNSAVKRTTGSWICMISPNAIPAVDAIVALASAVGAHPEGELAWGGSDRLSEDGTRHSQQVASQDWNAEKHLRDSAAIGLFAFHRDLVQRVGPFHDGLGPGAVYDWRLRAMETLPEDRFVGVPHVLAHMVAEPGGGLDALHADTARRRALERTGRQATLEATGVSGAVRLIEALPTPVPSATIIVRARQAIALEDCLRSVFDLTDYPSFDIVIVDVADQDPSTRRGIARLARRRNVSVIDGAEIEGGYAAQVNAAVASTGADVFCLLDDRIVVSEPGWLTELVGLAARAEVGVVGADVRSTDGTVNDIGTTRGLFGPAAARFGRGVSADVLAQLRLTHVVRAAATVPEACFAVRRDVWLGLDGLDAETFPTHFAVVDFCRRAARARYSVLMTPHAGPVLYDDGWAPIRDDGWRRERAALLARWRNAVTEDPYFPENLLISSTSRPLLATPVTPVKSWMERAYGTPGWLAGVAQLRARAMRGDELSILAEMADAALKTGRTETALKLARAAVLETPANPAVLDKVASIAFGEGENATAKRCLLAASWVAGGESLVWRKLAKVLMKTGELDEAIRVLETLVRAEPESIEARIDLAQVNLRAGRADLAYRIVRRLQGDIPDRDSIAALEGSILLVLRRFKAAVERLDTAAREDPADIAIQQNLGAALRAAGRPDAAAAVFEGILSETPGNRQVLLNYSGALVDLGDLDRARAILDSGLALFPSDADLARRREALGG